MRPKLFLLFLALWCYGTSTKAQDTLYLEKPRCYAQLGLGYPLPNHKQLSGNVAVVVETKRNVAYGLRLYEYTYLHPVPSSDHVDEKYVPIMKTMKSP